MKSDLQRGPGEDRNQQDSEPSRRSGRRRHPGDTRIPRQGAGGSTKCGRPRRHPPDACGHFRGAALCSPGAGHEKEAAATPQGDLRAACHLLSLCCGDRPWSWCHPGPGAVPVPDGHDGAERTKPGPSQARRPGPPIGAGTGGGDGLCGKTWQRGAGVGVQGSRQCLAWRDRFKVTRTLGMDEGSRGESVCVCVWGGTQGRPQPGRGGQRGHALSVGVAAPQSPTAVWEVSVLGHRNGAPQTGRLRQQTLALMVRRPEVQNQGVGTALSASGGARGPWCVLAPVCPHRHMGPPSRVGLGLTLLAPRNYFQVRSHSQGTAVRASTCVLGETIQQGGHHIACHCHQG